MRAMALFSWSAITVARPVAVLPWTSVPSVLQRKCRAHRMGLHALVTIAQPTSQPEVLLLIAAAPRRRDDVLDLQRAQHVALMAATVAAPVAGLCANKRSQVAGDSGPHGLSGPRRPRRTASARACAFRSNPSW